ncbi:Dihydrolipoyl dehydrogenase [Eubacterium plexicaudatum ASF492]|uniref:Dihydrolipoyl dehydrogenase n=1 Tax=Eubacterium plexicaudatum ASF492 TaxID=1235802 RepID=N2ANY2_9FIRM|nr:Dihydrolipoyl dehydrogenase [Eubacterium plexicaudatum ASF492]
MMYDLAIIGGGPAGYAAAFEAVCKELHVILFEKDLMGGTCLNRGCIPTKYLAHTAELYAQANSLDSFGIEVKRLRLNAKVLHKRKNEILDQLRAGLLQRMEQQKIRIVTAKAYVAERNVIFADDKKYYAKNILIASGSVPAQSFVDGAITSDQMIHLDFIPKSLKIIGGGIAAVEFASMYHDMGTNVNMCIRGERILRRFDKEISVSVTNILNKRGIEIRTNCTADMMKEKDAQVILSVTGRSPNTNGIFAKELGIRTDQGIVTDCSGRTNVPGIYAAGDVTDNSSQLAHVAMEQGKRAVGAMIGEEDKKPFTVVQCIYIHPEIALAGCSEVEARKQGKTVAVGKQTMAANARTMISTGERGFVKLVADVNTKKIIGAQVMCERAGDLISEIALAIDRQLTIEEMLHSVRPHPSYCEAVMEAAIMLKGKIKNV